MISNGTASLLPPYCLMPSTFSVTNGISRILLSPVNPFAKISFIGQFPNYPCKDCPKGSFMFKLKSTAKICACHNRQAHFILSQGYHQYYNLKQCRFSLLFPLSHDLLFPSLIQMPGLFPLLRKDPPFSYLGQSTTSIIFCSIFSTHVFPDLLHGKQSIFSSECSDNSATIIKGS